MGYRSHRLVMDNVAGVRCFTSTLAVVQRIGVVPISEKRIYVWTAFNSRKRIPQTPTWPRFRRSATSRCGACSPRCRRRSRSSPPISRRLWVENWHNEKAFSWGTRRTP